jgi:hypothetical protein
MLGSMKKIDLPRIKSYQLAQCKLFAEYAAKQSQGLYEARGAESTSKIERDILMGKVAECMVWNELFEFGSNPSPVDFALYSVKDRSYSADITSNRINFHIKSCDANSSFPNSWMFQKSDPLVANGVDFEEFNSLFLCVMSDVDGDWNGAAYYLDVWDVWYSGLFKPPILDRLKETKVCIYEEDILKIRC